MCHKQSEDWYVLQVVTTFCCYKAMWVPIIVAIDTFLYMQYIVIIPIITSLNLEASKLA